MWRGATEFPRGTSSKILQLTCFISLPIPSHPMIASVSDPVCCQIDPQHTLKGKWSNCLLLSMPRTIFSTVKVKKHHPQLDITSESSMWLFLNVQWGKKSRRIFNSSGKTMVTYKNPAITLVKKQQQKNLAMPANGFPVGLSVSFET